MPIDKKNIVKCPDNGLKENTYHTTSEIPLSSNPIRETLKIVKGCPDNELKKITNNNTSRITITSMPQKKNITKKQENNQNELIVESLKEVKDTFLVNRNVEEINKYLMNVNWGQISDNWTIDLFVNKSYFKKVYLNPYEKCSKENPLYMHKGWLNWIYTNKDLNLNDQAIGQICDCKNIGYWRQKFNIQTKEESGRYINPSGYIELYMPKDYKHPELNPMGECRIKRNEHIVKMEEYLMNSLTPIDLSLHPCLIKDKNGRFYIKLECRVHHINFRKYDNSITNLWLYKNDREHNDNDINICLSGLIKLGQILFSNNNNNKYYINNNYNYRILTHNQITEIVKPTEFFRFDDINLIREQIKKKDWSGMDWNIEYQVRNNAPIEKKLLNPFEDCSEKNPLYRHKGWMEWIINNSEFNMTDSRLAELCGIAEITAYRWRHLIHKIPKETWGFGRYMHTFKNEKQIWIKVPKSYGNPFVIRKEGREYGFMLEHRYIMEQFLAQNPQIHQEYLIDGKFLKPECVVHHINLDNLDNRLENLCVCRNHSNHEEIHSSLFNLIDNLLKDRFIIFKEGKYLLNY